MKSTIERNATKKRKRVNPPNPAQSLSSNLIFKLSELLQGDRGMIKVYSNAFENDIYFVNPAVCDPSTLQVDCPVYTTGELAQVLPLALEEFRRFHGVKTK